MDILPYFILFFDGAFMTVPSRITYEDFTESLARLDFTVNDVEKELSPRDLELHIDLSPCIFFFLFFFVQKN
jgi:hypothetical protein